MNDFMNDTRKSLRRGWDRIMKTWEENPLVVVATAGVLMGGTAKLVDAVSSARSRKAYARQVDYSISRRR